MGKEGRVRVANKGGRKERMHGWMDTGRKRGYERELEEVKDGGRGSEGGREDVRGNERRRSKGERGREEMRKERLRTQYGKLRKSEKVRKGRERGGI